MTEQLKNMDKSETVRKTLNRLQEVTDNRNEKIRDVIYEIQDYNQKDRELSQLWDEYVTITLYENLKELNQSDNYVNTVKVGDAYVLGDIDNVAESLRDELYSLKKERGKNDE